MIRELNKKYSIINTASTGTAAININGVTIHNLLRLCQSERMLIRYNKSTKKYQLNNIKLLMCDFICIDEISMIDGCTFDIIIDRVNFINKYRKKEIKLIIVGDCMQLPPVEKNVSGYYFNGGEYNTIHRNCYFCVLSEVKRQDNIEFIELLKRVRMAMHTKDDIKYIKNMENNEVNEGDFPIYMCAVNKKVDEINKKYFDENKNEPFEKVKKVNIILIKNHVKK